MDVFKTHGAFSWAELTTSDPQAAASFYGQLLGWAFDSLPQEPSAYRVVKAGDTPIGGVVSAPKDAPPQPATWGCYVTVVDIDEVAQHCARLGGRVLMPPTEIPTVGRMAVLQDPQGAIFNAIEYDEPVS
jgi:predicted enzyme related to lactoylglutathione lyase